MSSEFKKRLRMTRKQRKAEKRSMARSWGVTISEFNRRLYEDNNSSWRELSRMRAIFGEIERSPYE